MNLSKISTNEEANKIVGAIAQVLLDDMADTADMRVKLAEQIGYDRGKEEGYAEGYAAAQADIRYAMFNVRVATGSVKTYTED